MPRVTKGGWYSGNGQEEQLYSISGLSAERRAPNLASVVGDLPARCIGNFGPRNTPQVYGAVPWAYARDIENLPFNELEHVDRIENSYKLIYCSY
ncbi:hypothetical protein TSAR_009475 [Trichomalopsis sarcophagae]|uniref:Uncharacterized protein n=1 Tax=Trichomalopsis sarcophagae TaxID=543379 RepID=A0A232FHT2_9HYME|nr:hypothetical protein TSAR_009475 [Trichomalopsis sarcophagae]